MMTGFYTLAIETSTQRGTAALLQNEDVAGLEDLGPGSAHGRDLAPALSRLLAAAGLEPGEITAVAAGLGPGSYTGLRVGAATALGFSLGAGCALVGVSSLAAKAAACSAPGEVVLVAAAAGPDECYTAAYRAGERTLTQVLDFAVTAWRDVPALVQAGWILAGDAAERVAGLAPGLAEVRGAGFPDAAEVGRLGRRLFLERGATAPAAFRPLYLRRSSAEILWEQRHKKK